MAPNLARRLRLLLVTDDRVIAGRDPVDLVRQAVEGGVTAVELRLKTGSTRELVALARRLRQLDLPVLVNDRPDVARVAGVGVHLGPEDLPPELARRVLGREAIVGVSVGTPAEADRLLQAEAAAGEPLADYWGIGPWRSTGTKADAGAAIGPAGFAALARRASGRPCLAIGGVRPEDVAGVLAAGGSGVAVVSGILAAADVRAAARRYADQLGL